MFIRLLSDFYRGNFSFALLIIFASVLSGCAGLVSPNTTTQSGISVSPSSLSFKNVLVGQSLTQTIHVFNVSNAPLQIASLKVSNNDFVVSGPSVPRSILPGMGLDYTMAFTPTAAGTTSASLSIGSSASSTPINIKLSGVGQKASAAVQLSPSSVNFGNLMLQSTSTKNIVLQNTGDTSVKISGVTVAGAGFGFADLSPGFTLSPNQQVTFQVWFKPTAQGVASGTVSILSANLSSATTLSLSGDGVTSTTTPPPPPPTSTSHSVHLTWSPSTSSVVGYNVYRGQSPGGPYSNALSSSADALSFDDTTVAGGNTYYYVVTAVDSNGVESVYSNQATAQIPSN